MPALAATACGGLSSTYALATHHSHATGVRSQRGAALAYAGLGLAALADAVITLSTYHYIRRANRALSRQARLTALERLLRVTAETNALTFAAVVANLAVLAGTRGMWHVAFNEAVPALYTVSLLVSLTNRAHAGEGSRGHELAELSDEARTELERQRVRDAPWSPHVHQAHSSVDSALTLVHDAAPEAACVKPFVGQDSRGKSDGGDLAARCTVRPSCSVLSGRAAQANL